MLQKGANIGVKTRDGYTSWNRFVKQYKRYELSHMPTLEVAMRCIVDPFEFYFSRQVDELKKRRNPFGYYFADQIDIQKYEPIFVSLMMSRGKDSKN